MPFTSPVPWRRPSRPRSRSSRTTPGTRADADTRPVTLMAGIQGVHFPISTRRDEAQKFFDQGLTLVYAFNHDEAVRSFRKAAEIDPASPMPLVGHRARARPEHQPRRRSRPREGGVRRGAARGAAGRARAGEGTRVRDGVSQSATRTIRRRTSKALAVEYKDAMRQLTRTYPNDMHAATLYAESLMDLHPWQLWSTDGSPTEGTTEIVDVLERVLEREPESCGREPLLHSRDRGVADAGARPQEREAARDAVPAAGHLVHMPAHTYMRTGDYAGAVAANQRAAEVDRKYIAEAGANGMYPDDVLQPQPRLPRVGGDDDRAVRRGAQGGAGADVERRTDARRHADARAVRRQDDVRPAAIRQVERGARAAATVRQARRCSRRSITGDVAWRTRRSDRPQPRNRTDPPT